MKVKNKKKKQAFRAAKKIVQQLGKDLHSSPASRAARGKHTAGYF